jgi:hypothetical protein
MNTPSTTAIDTHLAPVTRKDTAMHSNTLATHSDFTTPFTTTEFPMHPTQPIDTIIDTSTVTPPGDSRAAGRRPLGGAMSFNDLLTAELRRLAPEYEARHAAHPVLAPYKTLPALVSKLTCSPKRLRKRRLEDLRRERAAILSVLLENYQRGFDRLWETLVLTALTPMLSIVRKRFTGADADEREGLFLLGVSSVIRRVDPRRKPEKIFGIIWMKTKKHVSSKLRKERQWSDVSFDVEADEVPDETMPRPEEYLFLDIVSEANGGEMVRARVPVDVLALSRRRIEAYVAREFACLPAVDQRALYECLSAKKEQCKELEGKTVPHTPRPRRRRASIPPDSGTRLRGDAGAPPTPAQQIASKVGS